MLSGDLEASIRELKARPGGELQVHGSGQLIRWLLEHALVDDLTLIVCPVMVGGGGTRLFAEDGTDVGGLFLASRGGLFLESASASGMARYGINVDNAFDVSIYEVRNDHA